MNSPKATHPRGLYTLFFTEMWERFSYYGMRALLVLFLIDKVRGGFGMSDDVATAIYGLYTASVYLASLPGGWLADRVIGAQKAVFTGGIIIALGHITLALERVQTFYLGLILIVIGTGLLKPNISALVAELYPEGGARRDSGFTIFYMGINIGAAMGPLVCGYLAQNVKWSVGFVAAAVGMMLGLVQFALTRKHLAPARPIENPVSASGRMVAAGIFALALCAVGLALFGVVQVDAVKLAKWAKNAIVGISVAYFAAVFLVFKLDRAEKRRMVLILILFVTSAIFWAGFEQMGSSFTLFAERHTERQFLGINAPASWFQSCGPVFIIVLSPVFASLWIALAKRNLDPSIPAKFAFGLLFLALGFVVMALGAALVLKLGKVGPMWLVMTYFLHTVGELCLSPVGLSSITKLAPKRLVGQMMGVWFTATSLGNLLAGLMAGEMTTPAEMRTGFWKIAVLPAVVGVVLLLLARPFQRWMHAGEERRAN